MQTECGFWQPLTAQIVRSCAATLSGSKHLFMLPTTPAHHPEAVRRLLRNIEVPPEGPAERRARQLDLLRGVRSVYERDYGHIPAWIAELRREVEAGRL